MTGIIVKDGGVRPGAGVWPASNLPPDEIVGSEVVSETEFEVVQGRVLELGRKRYSIVLKAPTRVKRAHRDTARVEDAVIRSL